MINPEEMKKKRFQFLYKLYEMSEGNRALGFSKYRIGEELGFDHELTGVMAQYLMEEGLVGLMKSWLKLQEVLTLQLKELRKLKSIR